MRHNKKTREKTIFFCDIDRKTIFSTHTYILESEHTRKPREKTIFFVTSIERRFLEHTHHIYLERVNTRTRSERFFLQNSQKHEERRIRRHHHHCFDTIYLSSDADGGGELERYRPNLHIQYPRRHNGCSCYSMQGT